MLSRGLRKVNMRHNKGCQFEQKSFRVPMGGEVKDNPCWSCVNNQYRDNLDADVVACVECKNYSNYKKV